MHENITNSAIRPRENKKALCGESSEIRHLCARETPRFHKKPWFQIFYLIQNNPEKFLISLNLLCIREQLGKALHIP